VGFDRITGIPVYAYENHYIWEDNITSTERTGRQSNAGLYEERLSTSETIDWTARANYNKTFLENLNVNVTAGSNYYDVNRRVMIGETQGGFAIPGIFNLANSLDLPTVTQVHFARRIIGAFGNVSLGWDDKIFLDASIRNDWSSTLPKGNESFKYASVGASVIVSDYLDISDNEYFNYFKFRTSYGTTGKDAVPYLLSNLYLNNPRLVEYQDIYMINTPLNGQPGASRDPLIGNNQLQPELTTTFEIGADLNFLQNKVQLQYTYYNSQHKKQIVTAELPRSTGYFRQPVNIGLMENKGHEVALSAVPIDMPNGLKWDINLTWSQNRSLVVDIIDENTEGNELVIWDSGRGVTQVAKEGHPFGTWMGQAPLMTPDGRPIVDANGSQRYTTESVAISSNQPDWLGGLSTGISYKGARLGVLFDTRQGGEFFSLTKAAVEFNGTGMTTIINDRQPFVIPNSVVENGDGSFSDNTSPINVDAYVDDGNYARHLLDGSFVKLREVTLGYQFPKSLISKLKLQQASVQLFAKNPMVWLPSENMYGDPEVNGPVGSTGNASGVESTQTPLSRSYGFNVNFTF
jgi:hypothetical protein